MGQVQKPMGQNRTELPQAPGQMMIKEKREASWFQNIQEANEDSGKFWKLLKRLDKQQEPNAPFNADGKRLYSDPEKAEATALFLGRQFTFQDTSDRKTISAVESTCRKLRKAKVVDPMVFTEEEVSTIIDKLASKKAPETDGIPNRAIKIMDKRPKKQLTRIINGAIRYSIFPKIWKTATVISIAQRLEDDLSEIFDTGEALILAGDLNAKHPSWNSRLTNATGTCLRRFADDLHLLVDATAEPTIFPHNGQPDVLDIVVMKDVVQFHQLTVLNELSSDHNPVLQLGQAAREHEEPWTPVRQVTEHVADSLKYATNTSRAVDDRALIPREVRDLLREKNRFRRQWQRTLNPAIKAEYNQMARRTKIALDEFRSKRWDDFMIRASDSPSEFWRAVMKRQRVQFRRSMGHALSPSPARTKRKLSPKPSSDSAARYTRTWMLTG
ncbi:hypothetical protein Trydic_g21898 [Trypoxylus dichotomus]